MAAGAEQFRPVFDGLANIGVFNLNPEVMRQPQSPDSGEVLRRDGSNVASVIERLQREDSASKARIEEYLGVVVPGVSGVSRVPIGSWETLNFQQDVPGATRPWSFQASSMSDGTLRALGVLVALFAGSEADPAAPIGIEEPESALHPAAMGALLDALRDASERRQVLVTTHSPDLLDSQDIGADELLAVRADRGKSIIERIDAAGRDALRRQLFTPGELLRVDQLHPDPNPAYRQDELFA
jgi:predicted ATPase